jgi:MFS transporter, SET family, sugar efflux transporter
VSGPIIAIGSLTVLGQRGIFLSSAVLTVIGLVIITIANRTTTTAAPERSTTRIDLKDLLLRPSAWYLQ